MTTIVKRLSDDLALTRPGDDITITYAGGTATAAEHIAYPWQDVMIVGTGTQRWYADGDYRIASVRASVGTQGMRMIIGSNCA